MSTKTSALLQRFSGSSRYEKFITLTAAGAVTAFTVMFFTTMWIIFTTDNFDPNGPSALLVHIGSINGRIGVFFVVGMVVAAAIWHRHNKRVRRGLTTCPYGDACCPADDYE